LTVRFNLLMIASVTLTSSLDEHSGDESTHQLPPGKEDQQRLSGQYLYIIRI
jgi:hypothetical protein